MGQQSRGKTRGEPPTVRRGPFHNRDTEKEMVHGATEQRENAGRGGDPGRRFGVDSRGNGIVDMLMNDLPNRTRHALHDICLQGRLNFCQHPTLSRGCSLFLIPYCVTSASPPQREPTQYLRVAAQARVHVQGGGFWSWGLVLGREVSIWGLGVRFTWLHLSLSIRRPECVYVRMYACTYVCVYVCMHVCIPGFTCASASVGQWANTADRNAACTSCTT